MNDLFFIAGGMGLRDGLNPCIFMTCSVFIIYGLWLKSHSLPDFWLRFIFVLVYAISVLAFDFGPAQIFVLQKNFIFAAKILYPILGAGAFVFGILFFKDWCLLWSRFFVNNRAGEKRVFSWVGVVIVFVATIILPLLLSALSSLWPINRYILVLGNEAMLRGQWKTVMPMLMSYVFFSMWALWFLWTLLSIRNLRPSLLKIICSSVFFTASSCMIFLFK